MFSVQYTLATTVKGAFVNIYKTRTFASRSAAVRFYERTLSRKNTTDVRLRG